MKPHEETWTLTFSDGLPSRLRSKGLPLILNDNGGLLFVTRQAATPEHVGLARAAPRLARALLAQGEEGPHGWHLKSCGGAACDPDCEGARFALREAGVLP